MSSNTKVKGKKKKDGKAAKVERKTVVQSPVVVSRKFGGNEFTGIIKEVNYGCQYLDGPAKYTWSTGISYEGSMASSTVEGAGKFCWPDGSSYEGELHAGKRHGQGVYVATDGVTRYEGQWNMGKRHGYGKLTYSADGASFYDGQWVDGQKHGGGRQVWPSGNIYEGEWENGKMRGEGTMRWTTASGLETYSGTWLDNNPHGDGTHTWSAAASPASPSDADLRGGGVGALGGGGPVEKRQSGAPAEKRQSGAGQAKTSAFAAQQQQQVNRYTGQWQAGKRSGFGTFYYANGASYAGEWEDHVKQGRGRHTLEDGRMYECDFSSDRPTKDPREMLQNKPSLPVGKGSSVAPNQVTDLIDIHDMVPLAMPRDCSGLSATAGTGYQEPQKVMREVHNAVLRHLTTMRDLYKQYRLLAPPAGEDPFVMRAYQLWEFARDAGLVTPSLPLARLDRRAFDGPRHRRETAPHDDVETRPLTPPTPPPGQPEPQQVDDAEFDADGLQRNLTSQTGSLTMEEDEEEAEEEEAEEDEWASRPETREQEGEQADDALDEEDEAMAERLAAEAEAEEAARRFVAPGGDFVREEGRGVADIHQPRRVLLFRHFLEAVVRLSPACFGRERGLESQVQRMLTERAAPVYGRQVEQLSETAFSFLVEDDFQVVLRDFRPTLWQLFCGPSETAEGEDAQDPEAVGQACVRRSQDFGATCRELHVGARSDRTARVRDVLLFLAEVGLLLPMLESSAPPADDEAAYVLEELAPSEPEEDGEADPAVVVDAPPIILEPPAEDKEAASQEAAAAPEAPAEGAAEDAAAELQDVPPAPPPEPDPTLAQCDFTITAVEVFRILAEVMSPESRGALRWKVQVPSAPDEEEWQELVSVPEFLETPLVFPEFVRLLLQVAERGSQGDAASQSLPVPTRFDGFLRHNLIPALKAPYVAPHMRPPPPPPPPEPPLEDAKEEPPSTPQPEEDKGKLSPKGKGGSRAEVRRKSSKRLSSKPPLEEPPVEVEQKEAWQPPVGPPRITHWLGFGAHPPPPGVLPEGARAAPAPRCWPDEYAEDVRAW